MDIAKNFAFLVHLLDQSNDAFQILDEEGNLLYVNEKACQNLGFTKQELLCKNVREIESIFQIPGSWEEAIKEIKQKKHIIAQGRNIRKDGSGFPAEISVKHMEMEGKGYLITVIRDISDRKRQESLLREIMNSSSIGIVVLQAVREPRTGEIIDFTYELANKAARHTLNYGKSLAGQRMLQLFPYLKKTQAFAHFIRTLETGLQSEYTIFTKASGQDRWFHYSLVRMEERHVVVTFTDITTSKVAEHKLEEQKENLNEILNALPINIFLKDKEGRFLFINEHAAKTVGVSPEDAVGKTDFDLFPKKIAHKLRRGDEKVSHRKELFLHQEKVIVEGKEQHMLTGKKLINSPYEHHDSLLLGFSVDITKTVNAHTEMEMQKRFIQQVIDTDPNLVFVKDKEGNFLLVNQAMADLYNTSKEHFMNQNNATLHDHAQEVQHYLENDREVIENGQEITVEESFTLPTGEVRWFQTTKKPLVNEKGETNVLAVCVDITQRKKDAEELWKAQKAKEQFLANMSHEIRTPINGIAGMINLLMDTPTTTQQKNFIESIKKTTANLKVIINDILDISAIESGNLRFERIGFIPEYQIRAVIDAISPEANEKGIDIKHAFGIDANMVLLGDPVRLSQILMNLLSNALKFTLAGEIIVKTRVVTQLDDKIQVEFSVADTGIGIKKEKLTEIFESFTQVDESVTRRFGGTGLGLSICKQLTELQGGTMFVESEEGTGSIFRCIIPYAVGTEEDLITIKNKTKKDNAAYEEVKGMKVLVVEDNEINRIYAKQMVSTRGGKVDVAENGLIALEKICKNPYDVVLMDIQMPVMDGLEATRNIRMQFPEPVCNLPIVALTANAIKGDKERCLAAGMNDYLSKPFEPEDLFKILKKYSSKKTAKKVTAADKRSTSTALPGPLPKIRNKNKKNLMSKQVETKVPVASMADAIDLTYLSKMCDGDKAFMREMIESFIKDIPNTLAALDDKLKEKDWEVVGKLVHKMKPAVQFMGLSQTLENIKTAESDCKNEENLEEVPGLIASISSNIQSAIPALQDKINNNFA